MFGLITPLCVFSLSIDLCSLLAFLHTHAHTLSLTNSGLHGVAKGRCYNKSDPVKESGPRLLSNISNIILYLTKTKPSTKTSCETFKVNKTKLTTKTSCEKTFLVN